MEWMLMPLRRYAEFTGRSRRKEFWMWMLLNFLVFGAIMIAFGATGGFARFAGLDPANPFGVYGALFSGVGILIAVWWLVTFVPNIALVVRRLHDRDMSGWWYLGIFVANFIPIINMVAGIGFLVLMCLEGTRGSNRFGPDPKDPTSADVFA